MKKPQQIKSRTRNLEWIRNTTAWLWILSVNLKANQNNALTTAPKGSSYPFMKRKTSKVSASPNAISWANWIVCLMALAMVLAPESSSGQGNPVLVGQWPGYARGPALTVE